MANNIYKSAFRGLAVALILLSVVPTYAVNKKPFVVPELKEWAGKDGSFEITKSSRIVVAKGNSEAIAIAKQFASDFKTMFGFDLTVAEGNATRGDIVLQYKRNKKLGAEGYKIDITDRVTVSAPENAGIYWATRSLLQIYEQNHNLPCGSITDFPDYNLRGFMIDCGRKYIPLDYLDDLVKVMSYYKMNTLQVHLNDNGFRKFFDNDWDKTYAAFRLESETYPGLAARDGYYTKVDFINFQINAESQFVDIIPEIDAPAHTLAFAHYNPALGSAEYGLDHLDLFNEETYTFLDGLFKEYLDGDNPVFRGRRVHIGTDEYSNKDQKVVEAFRAFTDRYIRYVESFGKQACVWGALTHANGVTPVKSENVVMSTWYNGYADPVEMKRLGYQQISVPDGWVYIVPAAGYYYDYLNCKYLYENWTPAHIGEVQFEEKDPTILGGMFAVWNDHCGNGISVQDIHHRIVPALQTIAAKTWDGINVSLPYAQFDSLRTQLSEAPGVNRLGRVGNFEIANVEANSTLPHREVGYNYRVSFDIDGQTEDLGTELFRSPSAVFYLSDPISGKIGFARDGYLNTFNYYVRTDDKLHITVEGTNKETKLYVNNKLIDNLSIGKIYFNNAKDSISNVRTLVFPLEHSGNFKSKITNLKVEQ
jgi:hexosaminidase